MIIPIVLSLNSAYTKPTAVAIVSALANAAAGTQYYFYLLTHNLTRDDESFIEQLTTKYTTCAGVKVIYFSDADYTQIPSINNKAREIIFRLFVPNLLSEIDKIIYLDSDILILNDLTELYNINLEGKAYAAVSEKGVHNFIRPPLINNDTKRLFDFFYELGFDLLDEQTHYVNAGVMVINAVYWREHNYTQRALAFLTQHAPNLVHLEQDALNYLALQDGPQSRHFLSASYNFFSPLFNINRINAAETRFLFKSLNLLNQLKENYRPHIVHYIAARKPWNGANTAFAEHYLAYAAQIGWHITPPTSFKAKLKRLNFKKSLKALTPYGLIKWRKARTI
ncbi:MAG: glycosyltransferase family 8 protein [Spirochaetaceae bacterium]|nr:glycosyltransferase family 8 protein [Spirochaetaceae bacterium]